MRAIIFNNFKLSLFCFLSLLNTVSFSADKENIIKLIYKEGQLSSEPFDELDITSSKKGIIVVLDGNGDRYFTSDINDSLRFIIGGALGTHSVQLFDSDNHLIDQNYFEVDCRTEIVDGSGRYKSLMDILYATMALEWKREASVVRYNNKFYKYFVGWLRDHVHTLKGMKYFYHDLKTGIDLYADSQREDGMIWDNYTHDYESEKGSYWVQRFRYGGFVKTSPEDGMLFTRIPVENDVEYLFIEGIYYTWKATGDNLWMEDMLEHALKAFNYSMTDNYRYSEKYHLLKRGYTIDTWDFQNDEDAAISVGPDKYPDPMIVKPEYTRFGIMFGDNTGFAASCGYLAEMLEAAGRYDEAGRIGKIGRNILDRTDSLCWNGNFYTHHVPENEDIKRDLGVDESKQISLSNSYSLNRNIDHEKAVKIINSYQNIRKVMPRSSPGEFYTIFPPFEKGFGSHNSMWNYMNGGVTSIVAGELAHGAFEHGYEEYGADILGRILNLARRTDNYLHCTYRGAIPEEPKREFTEVSIKAYANTDFFGNTVKGVMGWTNEGDNDLHEFPAGQKVFEGIPFTIVDPETNGRKACIGLSVSEGYSEQLKIDIKNKASSVYFLHTSNNNYYAGTVTLQYEDGSSFSDIIGPGKISNWWYPDAENPNKQMPKFKVAWRGKNKHSDKVGVSIYGLNNPYPEKTIRSIDLISAKNGTKWMVLGITLSDYPVFFMPDIVSGGIPDNWGAAAVVYALIEGLAGVKDDGQCFSKAAISPRWEAAGENSAVVTIKYPASGGYVKYIYNKSNNKMNLKFTGSMQSAEINMLMPKGRSVESVYMDGKINEYKIKMIEGSKYVQIPVYDKSLCNIEVILE